MTQGGTPTEQTTLVFTCVGRRVELVQAFRAAARRLGVALRVVGLDSDPTAPALSIVDTPVVMPRATTPDYISAVLAAVRAHRAAALIPTTDTDLQALARQRADIEALGCLPLIGAADIIDLCRDKIATFRHLRAHGIDTPETFTADEILAQPNRRYPLFIKPRCGSASQWVHRLDDEADLSYFVRRVADPIIQEFVTGVEHTLDVYVGLTGEPRCVVPRARWQVRSGEVSKGVTVKDRDVMEAGRRVVETLGRSVRGVVTLQCIVTPDRRIRFIEINPRFGGGAPLSIAAGADFAEWLLRELRGEAPPIAFDGFRHGLCMLRYDWAVFLPLDTDLQPKLVPPLRRCPDFG